MRPSRLLSRQLGSSPQGTFAAQGTSALIATRRRDCGRRSRPRTRSSSRTHWPARGALLTHLKGKRSWLAAAKPFTPVPGGPSVLGLAAANRASLIPPSLPREVQYRPVESAAVPHWRCTGARVVSRWGGRCCASILPPPRTSALDKEAPAEPCPHCRRSRAGSFRRQRRGWRFHRLPRLWRLHSAVRLRRVYLYLPVIPHALMLQTASGDWIGYKKIPLWAAACAAVFFVT